MRSDCFVDFKTLSILETQTSAHTALTALMKCEFQRLAADYRAGVLVERACCTVVSAAYLKFGFSVLGPVGRWMLSRGLEELSGVPSDVLMGWLESVAYSILEDMNVLQVVNGTPDWGEVDHSFVRNLWKAFLCSSADESQLLGLSLFASADAAFMRETAQQNIALLLRDRECFFVNVSVSDEFDPVFEITFRECMSEAASDHLVLLLWRIESYATFVGCSNRAGVGGRGSLPFKQDATGSGLFLMRDPCAGSTSSELQNLTGMAAVLVLLSDLCLENGAPVFMNSPATQKTLDQILRGKVRCCAHPESLSLLRGWLGELSSLPEHIERGLASGLLYEVRTAQNQSSFGVSSIGLRVLEPFRDLFIGPESLLQTGEWIPVGLCGADRDKGLSEKAQTDLAPSASAPSSLECEVAPDQMSGTSGAGVSGFADFYQAVQANWQCADVAKEAIAVRLRNRDTDPAAAGQSRERPMPAVKRESNSSQDAKRRRGSSDRSVSRLRGA